ncbi:MAG: hypothetical protein GDA49_13525 [Rhodospirillales bacterium]|nr:hypothetical protein [Rhodospirillales bacterium]
MTKLKTNLKYKTNSALLQALEEAAGREMTQAEVREQKISFVMGMIGEHNDLTRAQVAQLIDKQNGKAT